MKSGSFKFLIIIGHIFRFIPYISLNKQNFAKHSLAKIYPVLVRICFIVIFGFHLEKNLSVLVIQLINIAILLTATFTKKSYWKEWFKIYKAVKKLNKIFDLDVRSITVFPPYVLNFLVLTVCRIVVNDITTVGPGIMIIFIRLTLECIQTFFMQILCKGFKALNQHSKERVLSKKDITMYRNLYKDLYNMTVYFNKLFCWVFIMYLLELFLILCTSLNYLIELNWNGELNLRIIWAFILSCAARTVSLFINKSF